MKKLGLAGSTALVSLMAAPVFADVTPAEVWQSWQDAVTGTGLTITTAAVDDAGDTLTVSGLALTAEEPTTKVTATLDEMVFTDNGDGSVTITASESFPFVITATDESGAASTINLTVAAAGMETTVSGDAAEMTYDYTAPEISATIDSIESAEPADVTGTVTLTSVAGQSIIATDGDKKVSSGSYTVENAAFTMAGSSKGTTEPAADGTPPSGPSQFVMNATLAALTGTSTTTTVGDYELANLAAALKAGFATQGSFETGAISLETTVTDATGETKITSSGESSKLGVIMDAAHIAYSGGAKAASVSLTGPSIPLPEVTVSYAESEFALDMPIAKSDTPAPFSLLTKLVDLTISDDVWGLIDPTAQLSHDPATLIIDAKGTATPKSDFLDPAAAEAAAATPPELNSLDLTDLKVSAVGAELTGKGALTFDNTDLVTYGGMPVPTGKIDLKLVGANALMDKLVAMGMMPEDQVMGFRMMLSMFANATGEDEMTSTLEFKDKGFFANGQQLQ